MFDKTSAVAKRQIEYAQKYEEVHIIVFTDKSFSETTLGENIWIYPTRSGSRWLYIFDALKLGRFIVEKRRITHLTCQDPFETGLVGALIKSRTKIIQENTKPTSLIVPKNIQPTLLAISLELQIHTDIGSPYFKNFTFLNRIRTLISKYTLPRADDVRVVSRRIKEYIKDFVDPSHIEIRPIVVDIEKIKNSPLTADLHKKYPRFSKIILMVSRLEKEKNIEMAIIAFKKILEEIPEAGLVIVGSGSQEKRLKNLADRLGIKDSIIFEGWQDNKNDIISYYKTCDCYLLISWYEGYGMTLVEARAAQSGKVGGVDKMNNMKIVSTDVGVAREVGAEIVEYTPEDISRGIIKNIN